MSDLRDSLVQSGTLIGYLNTIVYAHNYNDLSNKPQINGVTLTGNKTSSELGLVTPATEAVQSVNGETGSVVLDGNDIAYNSNNTINQQIDAVAASIPVMAVTSVNGETGDVVLEGSDIRYDSDYTVSAKIAAVEGEIPVVPVQSVNGETGAVVLDGDDIAYNSSLSVNQKIDAVEAAIPVVSYPVTSVNSKTGAVVLDDSDIEHSSGVSVNSLINTILDYTPVYGNTASGAIATFDTSLALPLQDCTIAINAVQEEGTPTPSSPKAISGFDNGVVTRCGKNRLNVTDKTTTYGSYIIDNEYVPMVAGYYILSFDFSGTSNSSSLRVNDENETAIFTTAKTITSGHNEFLLNLPSKGTFVKLFSNAVGTYSNFQIEQGDQFTNFEAYNGNTYTFTFGQTVYGGSLDVTTGLLMVTHAIDTFNSFNLQAYEGNGYRTRNTLSHTPKAEYGNCLCNCFTKATSYLEAVGGVQNSIGYNNNGVILLNYYTDGSYVQDIAKLNSALPAGGCKIAYELATPITYQLTPTQISAIVGTNNVFTDTNGNTSVVYACSLKDYIDGQ